MSYPPSSWRRWRTRRWHSGPTCCPGWRPSCTAGRPRSRKRCGQAAAGRRTLHWLAGPAYACPAPSQRGCLAAAAPAPLTGPSLYRRRPPQVDSFSFAILMWQLWARREPYDPIRLQILADSHRGSGVVIRPIIPSRGGAQPQPGVCVGGGRGGGVPPGRVGHWAHCAALRYLRRNHSLGMGVVSCYPRGAAGSTSRPLCLGGAVPAGPLLLRSARLARPDGGVLEHGPGGAALVPRDSAGAGGHGGGRGVGRLRPRRRLRGLGPAGLQLRGLFHFVRG